MRKGRGLSRRMSLDDFVEVSHVLVAPSRWDLGVVGSGSACRGARNIAVLANRFADALRNRPRR